MTEVECAGTILMLREMVETLRGALAAAEAHANQLAGALLALGHDYMSARHCQGCETCRGLILAPAALAPTAGAAPARGHYRCSGCDRCRDCGCCNCEERA
jgi:hypothetical protein